LGKISVLFCFQNKRGRHDLFENLRARQANNVSRLSPIAPRFAGLRKNLVSCGWYEGVPLRELNKNGRFSFSRTQARFRFDSLAPRV
jgi:hypothetical protein